MKTILVADDSPGGREVVRLALELAGIQMPNLDGYGVIDRLRHDERFAETPVVALTASAMRGDEDRALAAGFARYISKPVNISALRQVVPELLA